MTSSLLRTAFLAVAALSACAAPAGTGALRVEDPSALLATRDTGHARPPLTVVAREGDARGAIAIAVTTEGIAPERGAMASVALAALTEERLAEQGVLAPAVGGWNGWRMHALVASPVEAQRTLEAMRLALLAPVKPDEPALVAVAHKAASLAARPLGDRARGDAADCTGEAFGLGTDMAPSAAELESWRASAHGLGRVAIATAGSEALADAAAQALARAPAWPAAARIVPTPWPSAEANAAVYDASGELAPGAARILVTARTATAERALAAASLLGDAHGALASRLDALPAPARLRSVVATARVDGGCLAATLDLTEHDLGTDGPARIATAAALARQELAVEVADVTAPADLGRALARVAADPRDAAERAAWWSLAGRREGVADGDVRVSLVVGIAAPRDAATPAAARVESLRSELDRATLAWHARVVESRTDVERGQGEVWVLLASPCGTMTEDAKDAGAGAAVALAAATQSQGIAGSARVEPFVAPDGVGLLAHGPRQPGETAEAHARRLADVAARTFAGEALGRQPSSRARSALLGQASSPEASVDAALAGALAPGHPSWVDASGTLFGLSSLSDDGLALRAAGLRAGPLRIAVLANVDDAQAKAAVRAADRWIARRPSESRACPSSEAPSPPRAATYAVERPLGMSSEAVLAIPLSAGDGDPATHKAASWLAATLDGPDGWLARALNATHAESHGAALAETWSAQVLTAPQALALVIRLTAPDASLDAAVAQTRALLDRLRQGALEQEDVARAADRIARGTLTAALDPRARAIALWRGEARADARLDAAGPPPSLHDLRAFAAASLRDEALVIVAARPPRVDTQAEKGHGRP